MAISNWGSLTWEELGALAKKPTVAILPVGAIEAHGPHLPLATDCLIAEGMAHSGAAKLEDRGIEVVLLPSLPFSAAPFAAAFPGTLSVPPATVTTLLLDLARELTRHGIAGLALANAHLDPTHRSALGEAAERARMEGLLPVVWPDITRRPWALRLTEEFQSGACHAGRFEGSVVLSIRPELVHKEVQARLEPNPESLSTAIRNGAKSFQEAGGPLAYFGWPADATAEEGRNTIQTLGGILADAVREVLQLGDPS